MKIGITGAEGTIGSVLRKGLSNKYKIIAVGKQIVSTMRRRAQCVVA